MIRDFIRAKNIKSDDFLYTITTYLYYHIVSILPHRIYTTTSHLHYHSASNLSQRLKLRGKLLPRLHIYKDFFLESVYFVLDFREL